MSEKKKAPKYKVIPFGNGAKQRTYYTKGENVVLKDGEIVSVEVYNKFSTHSKKILFKEV